MRKAKEIYIIDKGKTLWNGIHSFHLYLFKPFLHLKFLLYNGFNSFCFHILSTFTFSFSIFTCYYCIILHFFQFELKRLKKLVTQKICIPDCKISLDSFRCSVILSQHWIDVRRLKIGNTWHGSNWTKNFQAWISIVDF